MSSFRCCHCQVILTGGCTHIPRLRNTITTFFGKAPLCSIDPSEAVAHGAAVQGAILAGPTDKTFSCILLDVTHLSLGFADTGGVMRVVVPRNTVVPCKRIVTTTVDNGNENKFELKVCFHS